MRDYDVLVLGAGWGGLTVASMLADAGHRVAVLEARSVAGGCGQTVRVGDFSFSAEMQYLMGCGEGGVVHRWLDGLGIAQDIAFQSLDRDGYDRIDLGDFRFRVPCGESALEQRLLETFPGDRDGILGLFAVMRGMRAEAMGKSFDTEHVLANPFEFRDTLLYGPWPATRVFEHFGLSSRLRAVLAGQCGDIGLPPSEEPFLCVQALLSGYGESAHFPRRGMGHFVDAVLAKLRRCSGEVFFDTPVTALRVEGQRVTAVETPSGDFRAGVVVSNMDPALTMRMIDGASVPRYEQSASCFTLLLGLDTDLRAQGFGGFNVWSYPEEDIDEVIRRTQDGHDYGDPFFFFCTPSLHTEPGTLAPPGCTTVQINVASNFDYFDSCVQDGTHSAARQRAADDILAAVERRLVPNLRRHVLVQEAWSPVDLADRTGLVRGGMYGARLDFRNRVLRRVSPRTPYRNLFLTGATAGGPGLQGVVSAGSRLAEELLAGGLPS